MADTVSLKDIQTVVRARLEVVRAAKDEYERLEAALKALGNVEEQPRRRRRRTRDTADAPYGYKADGTPRKRPGRQVKVAHIAQRD